MEKLDCSKTIRELDCQIRALTPWPGTSVWIPERLKIRRARPRPEVKTRPGKLFEAGGGLFLGASDGCLELIEVQPEGKKPLSASEFLNGFRGKQKALGSWVWDLS
jgi:methionyl-tRNA formyltransferase